MALNAFLSIAGEKTGAIKGNAREGGNFEKITVMSFSQDLGDADPDKKGEYKHRPLVIVKAADPASPKLHEAHGKGDTFSTWSLMCFRVPPMGGAPSENHLTIILTGAKIVSYRTIMENNKYSEYALLPIMEEIAFAYEGINWSYKSKDGGGGHSVAQANPAPDKLDEWAKSIFVNAFKQHTEALMKELKVETKAMYQELMGEKKPPAAK